jgi:hypothetical protein
MSRNVDTLEAAPAGWARWPRRLRITRPRLTRLRLAVIGTVIVLLILWAAVAASATSIYSAQVVVVEGGALGIPPPRGLDFGDLPPQSASEKKISFENNGNISTGVMVLEWGGIRDLMSVSDAFFTLDSGEQKDVTFRVEPPPTAVSGEDQKYTGKVVVVRVPVWWPW